MTVGHLTIYSTALILGKGLLPWSKCLQESFLYQVIELFRLPLINPEIASCSLVFTVNFLFIKKASLLEFIFQKRNQLFFLSLPATSFLTLTRMNRVLFLGYAIVPKIRRWPLTLYPLFLEHFRHSLSTVSLSLCSF